jgi:hypothetical protein
MEETNKKKERKEKGRHEGNSRQGSWREREKVLPRSFPPPSSRPKTKEFYHQTKAETRTKHKTQKHKRAKTR